MIYQPHRYSRTKDLFEDFVEVLSDVDILLLLEVYSAGEKNRWSRLQKSLQKHSAARKVDPLYVQNETDVHKILKGLLKGGDKVVTQGAGSVGLLAKKLADKGFR